MWINGYFNLKLPQVDHLLRSFLFLSQESRYHFATKPQLHYTAKLFSQLMKSTLLSEIRTFQNNNCTGKMKQSEIDDLLRDSMFEDSSAPDPPQVKKEAIQQAKKVEPDEYGSEEFESYDESRRTFSKNTSKNQFQASRKPQQARKKLEDIKEEPSAPLRNSSKEMPKSTEKPRPKTGIYFYPPKQQTSSSKQEYKIDSKSLPYNYARLQEREKQLLLTTLSEQNKQLKQQINYKDNQYKKLDSIYKKLLQDKSKSAASVKQATLEQQLKILHQKYDKMQNLLKVERERNQYKMGKTAQTFVPQQRASERQEQLLAIIQKLKSRLLSTNTELKTLQNKLNEGQNYVDELKRKLKRIEQLEYKMEKMGEQAENDRQFINQLKDKNLRLQNKLSENQKQKKMMEIQIRRYELGQSTQTDTRKQLEQVKREKDNLEQQLRRYTSNIANLTKMRTNIQWQRIQDSGQLLRS